MLITAVRKCARLLTVAAVIVYVVGSVRVTALAATRMSCSGAVTPGWRCDQSLLATGPDEAGRRYDQPRDALLPNGIYQSEMGPDGLLRNGLVPNSTVYG